MFILTFVDIVIPVSIQSEGKYTVMALDSFLDWGSSDHRYQGRSMFLSNQATPYIFAISPRKRGPPALGDYGQKIVKLRKKLLDSKQVWMDIAKSYVIIKVDHQKSYFCLQDGWVGPKTTQNMLM